jgi:hypothetical protein
MRARRDDFTAFRDPPAGTLNEGNHMGFAAANGKGIAQAQRDRYKRSTLDI